MQTTYLTAPGVRARYGISKQTIWRWLRRHELGFPKPTRINTRLYWKLCELEAWESSREGGANVSSAA